MDTKHGRTGTIRRAVVLALALALITGAAGCAAVQEYSDVAKDAGVSSPQLGAPATTESDGGMGYAPDAGVAESAPLPGGDVAEGLAESDRLIIRNKTLRLEVEAVNDAIEQVRGVAKKHEGVITNMQVASDTEGPIYRYEDSGSPSDGAALSGWITVRVPVEKFDAFVTDVSKLGTVKYQAESSDDVTQEHVDMKARLDNLRAEEKRLREFFDKAKNVNEMLAIEQELSRVRGEIESLDAQVQYLERQAAMATVTIDLSEPADIIRPEGEDWGFGDAVTTGFRGAAVAIKILIVVIIALAPYIALGAGLFYLIRFIVRRRRAARVARAGREAAAQTPPDA
ncbi:MAG: DUF4349 domain-containing protein [Coriobacteriia bacterium]